MKNELSAFLDEALPAINSALDQALPPESQTPSQIHQAMRYSIFAGGKRLRPALCVASYAIFQQNWQPVLPVACAFEFIHTYSLIHDDLPAMDNDDFRRGLPSCHKKFGEATAILAGDALLTLAFETLARCDAFPADRMLRTIQMIGEASSSRAGLIAGQVLDLEAERRPITDVNVQQIHEWKTAALIAASIQAGAYLGGAAQAQLAALTVSGHNIGLAFQIIDDILDETSSSETLGKTSGKDRHQQKATYPAKHGLDRSRVIAAELMQNARHALRDFGEKGRLMLAIADYLENRSH